jgi:hypothetical protein
MQSIISALRSAGSARSLRRACNVASILASVIVLAVCAPSVSFAQESPAGTNRVIVSGGIALPTGNFGAPFPAQTLSSVTTPSNNVPTGNAQLGFNLGVSSKYHFTPNISLLASLDGSYNPYNNAEAQRLIGDAIGLNSLGAIGGVLGIAANASVNSNPYINAALLVGGRYDLTITSGLGAYASAQLGLMYSGYPSQSANVSVQAGPLGNLSVRTSSDAASAFPFVYAFGAGIVIADKINFGARWLGATAPFTVATRAEVSGTFAGLGTAGIPPVQVQNTTFSFPIGILSVTVGYVF